MADNVTANTSDSGGATFATDDATGVHWPYTKMAFGADNTQTIVGSISSNPLPVQLSATDNAVLDVIASATHVDAGTFTDSTSVGMGCYGVYQATPDTVADDDFSPILLNSSGAQVVDLGSNNDVTVSGVATNAAQLPDGHNVTVDNAAAGAAVNIQDGGNSITVDGTVTANPASGTIDTVTTVTTANLAAETTKVIGTVRMASGGVASGSFASGALASGSVAAGAVAAGATSFVELEDVASAAADAGVKVMAKRTAAPADTSGTDGDYEMLQMDNGLLWTALGAQPTGGMSYDMLAMAAADNDKVIKASPGTVYFISAQSLDATPVYLKLFDAASITPGTTNADLQFMIPANSTAANGAGLVLNFGAQGIDFATGIVALVATGIATDDNTAVSANEVIVTIGFK